MSEGRGGTGGRAMEAVSSLPSSARSDDESLPPDDAVGRRHRETASTGSASWLRWMRPHRGQAQSASGLPRTGSSDLSHAGLGRSEPEHLGRLEMLEERPLR